jgi:hypothetical protein
LAGGRQRARDLFLHQPHAGNHLTGIGNPVIGKPALTLKAEKGVGSLWPQGHFQAILSLAILRSIWSPRGHALNGLDPEPRRTLQGQGRLEVRPGIRILIGCHIGWAEDVA